MAKKEDSKKKGRRVPKILQEREISGEVESRVCAWKLHTQCMLKIDRNIHKESDRTSCGEISQYWYQKCPNINLKISQRQFKNIPIYNLTEILREKYPNIDIKNVLTSIWKYPNVNLKISQNTIWQKFMRRNVPILISKMSQHQFENIPTSI